MIEVKSDGAGHGLRLDNELVSRGMVPTRAKARDAILRGHVRVDGKVATKPALLVTPPATIDIDDPALRYVSRGALKLIAALDHFGYDPRDRIALDVGASTGGFTEVLLERGASRVHAIDVGHGQLDPRLAADPRVISREGFSARDLSFAEIGEAIRAVVVDVSFISLRKVLPPALAVTAADAWGVFLIKPQFEVGPEHVGKRGIVTDDKLAREAADAVAGWMESEARWRVDGVLPSPILGGHGNKEFLIGARHG